MTALKNMKQLSIGHFSVCAKIMLDEKIKMFYYQRSWKEQSWLTKKQNKIKIFRTKKCSSFLQKTWILCKLVLAMLLFQLTAKYRWKYGKNKKLNVFWFKGEAGFFKILAFPSRKKMFFLEKETVWEFEGSRGKKNLVTVEI